MAGKLEGEMDTFTVAFYQISVRPDGRKAILFEFVGGRHLALELPQEILGSRVSDLAKLAAVPDPPNKPNA